MNQQTQVSLQSLITTLLTLVFSIPAIAAFFPKGTLEWLQSQVGPVFGAIGLLVTVALTVWKMLPMSKAKKVALAAELPDVSRVVTTPAIVSSEPVKSLPDAKAFVPTVVGHDEAMLSSPPKPMAV